MDKLLIFGTGSNCKRFLKETEKHLKRYDIIGFLDNNEEKKGKVFAGKCIYSPCELDSLEYDYIYIASGFKEEIKEQLINECKVQEECIVEWWHFGINSNLEINEKRASKIQKSNDELKTCKMVIYTAIFGEYDNLNDPSYIDDNCDYVCFTDDENLTSKVWDIRIIKDMDVDHPRKKAEHFSILAHRYFSEYELSVYVDGNVLIHGDMRQYTIEYMKCHNMLVFPHPWRCCAYEEARFSMTWPNYLTDNLDEMIHRYEKEGFPKEMGLVCCGILVRRHNEEDVVRTMERWWNEVKDNSSNDQVSYPFAVWKEKFFYDMSPLWIYDNEYETILKHKKDM